MISSKLISHFEFQLYLLISIKLIIFVDLGPLNAFALKDHKISFCLFKTKIYTLTKSSFIFSSNCIVSCFSIVVLNLENLFPFVFEKNLLIFEFFSDKKLLVILLVLMNHFLKKNISPHLINHQIHLYLKLL